MKQISKTIHLFATLIFVTSTLHGSTAIEDYSTAQKVTEFNHNFSLFQAGFFVLNMMIYAIKEVPPKTDAWLCFLIIELAALACFGKSQRMLWSDHPPVEQENLSTQFIKDTLLAALFDIFFYQLALVKGHEPLASIGMGLIFFKTIIQLIPALKSGYSNAEMRSLYYTSSALQTALFNPSSIKNRFITFLSSWKNAVTTSLVLATFGTLYAKLGKGALPRNS